MNSIRTILFFVYLSIFVISCGDSSSDDNNAIDFYLLDKTKLTAEIIDTDLGITFQPPVGWAFQSAELSKKKETQNNFKSEDSKNFQYQPTYLFFSDSTYTLLSIGKIEYPDTSISAQMKLNLYKNLLSNKLQKDKLSIGSFKKSNLTFNQFKSEKENFINYKIIFLNSSGEIIQFDCTITKQNIEHELILFKSFIGSVLSLRKK